MSSDLWEAFGDKPKASGTSSWHRRAASVAKKSHQQSDQLFDDLLSPQPPVSAEKEVKDHDSDADSWSAVNQELEDAWNRPQNQAFKQQPQSTPAAPNTQVAFSADGFGDDDDFGDFESPDEPAAQPEPPPQPRAVSPAPDPQPPNVSSLEIDDDFGDFEGAEQSNLGGLASSGSKPVITNIAPQGVQSSSVSGAPKPSSTGQIAQYDPFADLEQLSAPQVGLSRKTEKPVLQPSTEKQPKKLPKSSKVKDRKGPLLEGFVMAEENPDPNEQWDDFSEPAVIKKSSEITAPTKSADVTVKMPSANNSSKTPSSPGNALPPTNVPPPSILIPLISAIIQELPEEIDTLLRSYEEYQGDKPAVTRALDLLSALEDQMNIIKVAGRVLAGRKLRWKRDTILSQSMSIGAAGRPGGMKLTGVDKTETQREDREAAEFVRAWKKNSGRIRGAVMKMPAQIDEKPTLPHVAETLPVRTLKENDGGIKAPKQCVLCGLKREERVEKSDTDVWDQFGEWWTEHWGHTQCRTFWNSHEQFLEQR